MRTGDVLGFANRVDNSVIGHHFEAVPLLYAENGPTAKLGDNITFDSLLFPYKFAYALTYVEGMGGSVQVFDNFYLKYMNSDNVFSLKAFDSVSYIVAKRGLRKLKQPKWFSCLMTGKNSVMKGFCLVIWVPQLTS